MEKVVLINDLSPGDILIMSVAIKALHKAYPGRYITDVRSPCNEIYENNPYTTPLRAKDPREEKSAIDRLKKNENIPPIIVKDVNGDDVKYIISHYPEIHRSKMTGLPFADGHRMFLEKQLGIPIPRCGMQPDIFLSNSEKMIREDMPSKYWIINAGIKNDYTLKYYNHYQEVVDMLKDKITFIQVGHSAHNHPPLNGENVIDMRGKTNLRELFALSYHAEGSVNCVSMQMVIMAAFSKPCVVVAGAREGTRWQLNPDHQFLYRTGVMKCAPYDGCWKSKVEDCIFKSDDGQPMCLELIAPEEIVRAINLYYLGGRLEGKSFQKDIIFNDRMDVPNENIVAPKYDGVTEGYDPKEIIVKQNKKEPEMEIEKDLQLMFDGKRTMPEHTSAIINTLRILKKNNPNDGYLEAYYWHINKNKDKFFDLYHFLWWLGSNVKPKRILEIGCRTGVSICQYLSSMLFYDDIEKIIICDNFSEIGSSQTVLDNLRYLNIPTDKIQFMVGSSLDEIPRLIELNEKFDSITVDACHDKPFAAADLENASQLIGVGGYILMDDISEDGCSLDDVWQEFKYKHKNEFKFFENYQGKGLGVAMRRT